jgi:hypothetical protein
MSVKSDNRKVYSLLRQLRFLEQQAAKYKDLDIEDILINKV